MDTVFFTGFAFRWSGKVENQQPGITRHSSDGLVEADGRVHASHVTTVSAH